jgi:hypothetical protein
MKLLHTLKRIFSDKGLLLTLALSLIFLFVFYGPLLLHPAKTYFWKSGDGMQTYYQTLYHVKYDTTYWQQQSINYPYGESIFFTSAMPLLANFAKLFGTHAGPFGVALINLSMLLSIVLGALFIYAIFRHLRLPWLYGSITATAIAFLSPQILRMSGHYSLSWVYVIPAFIYMLLRFYDFPSLKKSIIIAVLAFLAAGTHLYYFVFFFALSMAYWAVLFFTRDRGFGRFLFLLKHVSIQLLLPFLLIELLILFSSDVLDRTAFPWRDSTFYSNFTGIFFPHHFPYRRVFEHFWIPKPVEFEGTAYVGLTAMGGLLVVFLVQCWRVFKKRYKLIFTVTDNKPLTIFFWASLIMLWFSFEHPFLSRIDWLNKIGLINQFRTAGRFNWLFFYMVNIVAVYRLYRIAQHRKWMLNIVWIGVPVILLTDATFEIVYCGHQDQFNNRIAELEDRSNIAPEHDWLGDFDSKKYQAILPLPYFHLGSENIMRISPDPEIVLQTYIVSLKTGLPIMAVSASRTSLSQTNELVSLVLDPLNEIVVLNKLKDDRPFLLVAREGLLDLNEKRLIEAAQKLIETEKYHLYSIRPSEIRALVSKQYQEQKANADAASFVSGPFRTADSAPFFIYHSYDDLKGKPFRGNGSFSFGLSPKTTLLDTIIPQAGNYVFTCWINRIGEDVYPRCEFEILSFDEQNHKDSIKQVEYLTLHLKAIHQGWGLVEYRFKTPCDNARVQIRFWNKDFREGQTNELDEVFLFSDQSRFYQKEGETIWFNNRCYSPSK